MWAACGLALAACRSSAPADPGEATPAAPEVEAPAAPEEAPAEAAPEESEEPGEAPVAAAPPELVAPDGTKMLPCAAPPPGMACVPGGPMIRGADDGPENARPQATVWVQTYYMDIDEVTYGDYKACEKAKRCNRGGPRYVDFDRPEQPINGVNWFDAVRYCESHGKRLPTEAEWEKASRGPDGELHPWGNETATCERAIIKGEQEGRGCGLKKAGEKPETGRPWPVGSRPAYRYGLRDIAGNSYEWVADWYTRSYEACGEACVGVDPKGPCGGADPCPGYARKVVRGGSWYWDASRMTGVHRRAHQPANAPHFHHFGFRCAASLEQGAALVQQGESPAQ
ncbi:MAG: SUMF1/EgtB/PvdO family nonheme iron enzyme [Nannocystaceae bacterium]|nr:SUMF1/EgtB/PvdO family nonheme iron enzyme [Myxococcales bacterium]